jgi:hypothetical protein
MKKPYVKVTLKDKTMHFPVHAIFFNGKTNVLTVGTETSLHRYLIEAVKEITIHDRNKP